MRKAGILMPLASLPGGFGIGDFQSAEIFLTFLKKAGQTMWQLLPLCPTSYGDSPYQSPSVFALNPYYISLAWLKEEGLLLDLDLPSPRPNDKIDYAALYEKRYLVLQKAFSRFVPTENYHKFLCANQYWLFSYAMFMCLKYQENGCSWQEWEEKFFYRAFLSYEKFYKANKLNMDFWYFVQYKAAVQWNRVREYAQKCGVELIGDMAIYPALDSADVWANPEIFDLDKALRPNHLSGCPPDDFCPRGQLWGNPIYRWSDSKEEVLFWWQQRIQKNLAWFDSIRVDHFIGFFRCYAVKATAQNASQGAYREVDGEKFWAELTKRLGALPLIAEDLGYVTPPLRQRMDCCGYPTMKVLQFAFDQNPANDHLPCHYVNPMVCYTGTHDNNTLLGWVQHLPEKTHSYVLNYVKADTNLQAVENLIELALSSVAERVFIPLQDYLKLGSEARINTPGTVGNNFCWRAKALELSDALAQEIYNLIKQYQRV